MKIVIRLLTEDRQLLGWAEVEGQMRGDGCIWSKTDRIEITVERSGVVDVYNAHWVDLNVNLSIPVARSIMDAGQIWSFRFTEPIFRFGRSEDSLPPVTVRKAVTVEAPTGIVGVVIH